MNINKAIKEVHQNFIEEQNLLSIKIKKSDSWTFIEEENI